jgi:hypothetical protein
LFHQLNSMKNVFPFIWQLVCRIDGGSGIRLCL